MIAGGHEDIGAGVDGSVRELLEELSRTARFRIVVAADGTLVRMDRHDDEIRIFPRCADALVDLGEILRIHGVLVGEGIRLPIFGGEQLDIGGHAAAVLGVEDAVDLCERLHCGRGHRDGHRQVKGIDAGASGRGTLAGSASVVGRKVEAREMSATRPAALSRYWGARASPRVSPTPA